jgi:hypothetical protein
MNLGFVKVVKSLAAVEMAVKLLMGHRINVMGSLHFVCPNGHEISSDPLGCNYEVKVVLKDPSRTLYLKLLALLIDDDHDLQFGELPVCSAYTRHEAQTWATTTPIEALRELLARSE